jgi:hypothetical protein
LGFHRFLRNSVVLSRVHNPYDFANRHTKHGEKRKPRKSDEKGDTRNARPLPRGKMNVHDFCIHGGISFREERAGYQRGNPPAIVVRP